MPRTTLSLSTRLTSAAATALTGAVLLTGCGLEPTQVRLVTASSGGAPTPAGAATATATTTAAARPSTARPATARPQVAAARPAAAPVDLAAVQRRLRDLHYYVARVDGRGGPATRSAVMAFQKVNGLVADGTVGPRTLAALAAPKVPVLRLRSPGSRVEVDLDRQVLHVVQGGAVVRTVPVSSGNGERYREADGSWARALTPVGTYRIERRIAGVRKAALGTLYDPQYFHRGWAVHGSDSVPAYPASHGCVRVTRADATYLFGVLSVGTTVHLYGGTHVFEAGSGVAGTSTPAA